MRESTKSWLFASVALISVGSILFTVTGCAINWDFKKFSTIDMETNTHTIGEDFNNITMDTDTTDIILRPSENGECKVVCYEDAKQNHSVRVENGTLTIQEQDERVWHDYINIGYSGSPTITVYLPKTQYADLSIETHTGDITIMNNFLFNSVDISGSTCDVTCSTAVATTLSIDISTGDITLNETTADTVSLTVSTGDIDLNKVAVTNDLTIQSSTGKTELEHVTSKNYTHNSTSGDVEMENVFIFGKMQIETSSGDVEFEHCDAGEIYIKTSTGDVAGSLLTAKDFHANTSTGKVKVPSSSEGGKCEINTSTGDIEITVVS